MQNPSIFNTPKDGYYHIVPLGTFDHDSGVKQVIDKQACESMVKNFQKEKASTNFPGLLADFDHNSYDTAQPSTAAGWIEDLQNRNDGLYAKVKWSDIGDEAVKGGRFRLVSPVWKHRDCDDLGEGRIRPNRLDSIGLTNSPNIKGMRPLSNTERTQLQAMLNRAGERNGDIGYVPRAATRSSMNSRLIGNRRSTLKSLLSK